jgi:hypothetical protein
LASDLSLGFGAREGLQAEGEEGLDFGDAPTAAQSGFATSYPVTLAQNGARHTAGALFLGASIDVEANGIPANLAVGDDNNGSDDEESFGFLTTIVSAAVPTKSSLVLSASGAGKLDGWIDFNRDGDWNDAGEQIFVSQNIVGGASILGFTVPAGARAGITYARFRLSTAGGLSPTGAAPDGEVEDYSLTIVDGTAASIPIRLTPFLQSTVDVVAAGNQTVIRREGIELFRAPNTAIQNIGILGSAGNDVLRLGTLSVFVGGDAAGGFDTLQLIDSGQVLDLPAFPDFALQNIEAIDITGTGPNTLMLNLNEVRNLSTTTDTLRVMHNEDDKVSYGAGWTVAIPRFVGGRYLHIMTQAAAVVEVSNNRPYQNPNLALDTDRSGFISAVDVLRIINLINESEGSDLPPLTDLTGATDFSYFDTSGDGIVSALDVLLVINFLNEGSGGEGEGASAATALDVIPGARHDMATPAITYGSLLERSAMLKLREELVTEVSQLLGRTTEPVVTSSHLSFTLQSDLKTAEHVLISDHLGNQTEEQTVELVVAFDEAFLAVTDELVAG